VRKHQTRNLEIPGSMLSHRPGMTSVQLLMSDDQVFSIILTTASGIGM